MANTALTPSAVRVDLVNGQPTTTSLDIAAHFGKRHTNVLRAINDLDCSPKFRQLNFELTINPVSGPRGAVRDEPMYRLTRDGFVFLAMGFTGPEAAKWKEAYIEAFNRLAAEVAHKPAAALPLPPVLLPTCQAQAMLQAAFETAAREVLALKQSALVFNGLTGGVSVQHVLANGLAFQVPVPEQAMFKPEAFVRSYIAANLPGWVLLSPEQIGHLHALLPAPPVPELPKRRPTA